MSDVGWELFARPDIKLLCQLPSRVISLKVEDDKIIAETETGWYEILEDGSYVGILK